MQAENEWVVAGDLLFSESGYELSPKGQAALNQHVPQLKSLQNAKVVVFGFTDSLTVGPALQRAGVANNVDLSSRRADNVVSYFRSQVSTPISCRPKVSATRIRSPQTIRRRVGRRTAALKS
jgi:outer membrane protein OmpA-like peptidoglycan-associated protein